MIEVFLHSFQRSDSSMNPSRIVFLLSAIAVVAVFADDVKHLVEIGECITKVGLEPVVVEAFKRGDDLSDDPKVKCFHACIMKSMGTMTNDGKIDVEAAIKMIPENMPDRENFIEAIKTCSGETGTDECDLASKVHGCMKKQNIFPHHQHKGLMEK